MQNYGNSDAQVMADLLFDCSIYDKNPDIYTGPPRFLDNGSNIDTKKTGLNITVIESVLDTVADFFDADYATKRSQQVKKKLEQEALDEQKRVKEMEERNKVWKSIENLKPVFTSIYLAIERGKTVYNLDRELDPIEKYILESKNFKVTREPIGVEHNCEEMTVIRWDTQ